MEPQEIPPFVYQLLFLCDQSDHLVPLEHLATYFQSKLRRFSQNNAPANGDSMEIDSDIIGISKILMLYSLRIITFSNGNMII